MNQIASEKSGEEKDHAEYSASGSSRWLNCPGSHVVSKTKPPLPESKYAAEGTQAHACLEFILQNREKLQAAVTIAAKTYPREMVEHALDAVKYVLTRAAELPGSVILCERRVDSSPFLGVPGQFGTLDISIVQLFGKLIVADYKYGAGISVDPREDDGRLNSQMAYYGLGLSYEYDHNFESVELVVIQPRAYHESGETIRSATADIQELLGWTDIFYAGVRDTLALSPRFAAGKWCRFCPASLDCPELKDKSFKAAQIAFSDTAGITKLPEPTALPNLGVILNACDKLEEWIGKVRAHAIDVLNRGGSVPGFKLVEKRGTRKWVSPDESAAEALRVFGNAAFTEPVLKSPAQMEKAFGKTIKPWVESRVTTIVSGTTLATADDKRPAVSGIADVFGVIDV